MQKIFAIGPGRRQQRRQHGVASQADSAVAGALLVTGGRGKKEIEPESGRCAHHLPCLPGRPMADKIRAHGLLLCFLLRPLRTLDCVRLRMLVLHR